MSEVKQMSMRTSYHAVPRWAVKSLLVAAVTVSIASCKLPLEVNGNLPDPDGVAQIKAGVSSKAEVTRFMGSPSSVSTFDKNTWYYASRKVARDTLGDSSVVEQRVYVVVFDDKGVVKDFQTHLDDEKDVAMIARATPAPGRELSFLEQTLGNFGKFTGNKKKKDDDDSGDDQGQ